MSQKISQRLLWAIETLNIQPDDQLLEIGCGNGIAVSLIADHLTTGKITAIDRSEIAITTAIKRNEAHIAAGKAEFHTTALTDFQHGQFNKIFAVNVNVFWLKPAKEIAVLKKLLTSDGLVYLFYEPPGINKAKEIAENVQFNLQANGFAVREILFKQLNSASGVCIFAQRV